MVRDPGALARLVRIPSSDFFRRCVVPSTRPRKQKTPLPTKIPPITLLWRRGKTFISSRWKEREKQRERGRERKNVPAKPVRPAKEEREKQMLQGKRTSRALSRFFRDERQLPALRSKFPLFFLCRAAVLRLIYSRWFAVPIFRRVFVGKISAAIKNCRRSVDTVQDFYEFLYSRGRETWAEISSNFTLNITLLSTCFL